MVFRNGGNIRQDEKWFYNDNELEIVNEFNYLGGKEVKDVFGRPGARVKVGSAR